MTAPRSAPVGESAPARESATVREGWEGIYARSLDCVHCGLCLSSCPTYVETGREISSPRGRIYLMRGAAEARIPVGDVLAGEAFLCLGCRACETACPSGVRYGAMLEEVRAEIDRAGLRPGFARAVERFALRSVVPRPGRLRLAFDALSVAQRIGLVACPARSATRRRSCRACRRVASAGGCRRSCRRRGLRGVASDSSSAVSCPSSSAP
jgi:glycolate oxidase iron-sulfur subunit